MDNGNGKPPSASATGRDDKGRFGVANAFSKGNPHGKRVNVLRSKFLMAISEEDIEAIGQKLVTLALAGDTDAAKLVLSYCIGKPDDMRDESDEETGPIVLVAPVPTN